MVSNNFEEDLAVPSAESEAPRDEILPSSERAPADAGFPSAKTRAAAVAKVFVKCDDGQWRIASYHGSRREAQSTADLLGVRHGVVARVML
jgi:hypothetical protein